jgi:hypothetical protein
VPLGDEVDTRLLMQRAAALRDQNFGNTISYSRKVFIPLTQLCRDSCHYCTFARPPRQGERIYMSPEQILAVARQVHEWTETQPQSFDHGHEYPGSCQLVDGEVKALIQRQNATAVVGFERSHGAGMNPFNGTQINVRHIAAGLQGRHAFQRTAHRQQLDQTRPRRIRNPHHAIRQHFDAAFGDEVKQRRARASDLHLIQRQDFEA